MVDYSIWNDDNYRDPLDNFTDREQIVDIFKQFLRSAQAGKFNILSIKGNSGTGKTFLISYLNQRIFPGLDWKSGQLNFVQSLPDFRSILVRLEDAFKHTVSHEHLKRYRDKRDEYIRRFDEYRTSMTIGNIHFSIEATKGASIADVSQSIQVHVQLRERELQLRSELSRTLIDLAEESTVPLCLFIDGYERLNIAGTELVGWLWEEVLFGLVKATPKPLLIVTGGWEWPANAFVRPFAHLVDLNDFNKHQVRSYLEKRTLITTTTAILSDKDEELITAFYELTKGHPLVLGLAVAYFKELDHQERTIESLQAGRLLIDDRAHIELLEERLLSRLTEPYRTLLERGPILRFFDQKALQALLSVEVEGSAVEADSLNDQVYRHFLQYPFVNQTDMKGDRLLIRSTFHELVRQVRLEMLRQQHPYTKEQLHRKMVDYYSDIANTKNEQEMHRVKMHQKSKFMQSASNRLAVISEREFSASLEYLYHALQVKEFQVAAIEEWRELAEFSLMSWTRQQTAELLELIQGLAEEGEPFFGQHTYQYGQYLHMYSRFLAQDARWEEARTLLERAIKIFEQLSEYVDIAFCLNQIGLTYTSQGDSEQALDYFERALHLLEQEGKQVNIAPFLCNIGICYFIQGRLEKALTYLQRSLILSEQAGIAAATAQALNSIGLIYKYQGKLKEALSYYEQALNLLQQVGDPANIAMSLNNIGEIYRQQGNLKQAMSYFEQALSRSEQAGNSSIIAIPISNIGQVHRQQGRFEQALSHFEQALSLFEQGDDSRGIVKSLNNIGDIYREQRKYEQAIDYLKRALALTENTDNLVDRGFSLGHLGKVYYYQKKFEEALSYYNQALILFEEMGDPLNIASNLHNIANIYEEQGEWKQEVKFRSRALALFERLGPGCELYIIDQLKGLALAHTRLGERIESLNYERRVLKLRNKFQNKH